MGLHIRISWRIPGHAPEQCSHTLWGLGHRHEQFLKLPRWFHGQAGLEAKAGPDQGSLSWLGSGVTCSRVLDQGRGVHGEEAIGHHRPQPWSTSALFWVLPSLPDGINLGNMFKLMFLRLLSENNHTNLQHCLTIKWGKKSLKVPSTLPAMK